MCIKKQFMQDICHNFSNSRKLKAILSFHQYENGGVICGTFIVCAAIHSLNIIQEIYVSQHEESF